MLCDYPLHALGDGLWEINEFDGASMFLAVGEKRALLMDTGVGIGNLRKFVSRLADRPLDVLLTHNHRDHVGNAPLFDRVHLHPLDMRMGAMIRPLTSKESRLQFAENTRAVHPDIVYPWTEADIVQYVHEPEMMEAEDGFVFDLGGRQLRCVWTPGHTPGSLSVIDSQTGTLFCGDAFSPVLGLGVRPIDGMRHATIEEAHAALVRLNGMDFDRQRMFNGHSHGRGAGNPMAGDALDSIIEAMEMVLSGQYTAMPKHIASIHADVEIFVHKGMELQFHSSMIHGTGKPFFAANTETAMSMSDSL